MRGRVRKRLHTYRVGEFPPGLEVHVGKADDFTLLSVKQQPAASIMHAVQGFPTAPPTFSTRAMICC
jgi:hypothetical protein